MIIHEKNIRVPVEEVNATLYSRERRLPPQRQVEFHIDLIPGATPVAKSPYRLAFGRCKTVSEQLQSGTTKIIRPITHLGAPILFVKKNDGSIRMCT
ncbi:hypothetical protein Tco_0331515 [Tanacetum coccineum]